MITYDEKITPEDNLIRLLVQQNVDLSVLNGMYRQKGTFQGLIAKAVFNAAQQAQSAGGGDASMGEIILKSEETGTVTLDDGVAKSIVYIDLPVGSWKVFVPSCDFEPLGGAALVTTILASISLTNNTIEYDGYNAISMTAGALTDSAVLQPCRLLTLTEPTRVYLVMYANFSANGITAYGQIAAQRVPSITVQT